MHLSDFLFISILSIRTFFVKDLCGTLQARIVIFGMQVDDDVLYCDVANKPSSAYFSPYLSDFLSF